MNSTKSHNPPSTRSRSDANFNTSGSGPNAYVQGPWRQRSHTQPLNFRPQRFHIRKWRPTSHNRWHANSRRWHRSGLHVQHRLHNGTTHHRERPCSTLFTLIDSWRRSLSTSSGNDALTAPPASDKRQNGRKTPVRTIVVTRKQAWTRQKWHSEGADPAKALGSSDILDRNPVVDNSDRWSSLCLCVHTDL